MSTINLISYSTDLDPYVIAEFEQAVRHTTLRYSMKHLLCAGLGSHEMFDQTLARSIQVCKMAGINVGHHFKQIFVFDTETGAMYTDWLMSRNGMKLILMQYPELNEQLAQCMWEITER